MKKKFFASIAGFATVVACIVLIGSLTEYIFYPTKICGL